MSAENMRGTCNDDQRRDRTVKERKKCRNSGALLCKTGSSGDCRLCRRFFLFKQSSVGLKEKTIVFCGVSFMGESAKILNPEKTVLMPDMAADCPMAHMASAETIEKIRSEYDDLAVVCYINSTVELKALADVCVTSANAVKIVKNLPNKNIFFIPDRNLGTFVQDQVPEKNIILNQGHCPRHTIISKDEILNAKKEHPQAWVAVHPECTKDVTTLADFVGSTSAIIDYVVNTEADEFIIGTVDGVFYKIHELAPDKKLYRARAVQECVNMKKVTLEKVLDVLTNDTNEVFVASDLAQAAMKPLNSG